MQDATDQAPRSSRYRPALSSFDYVFTAGLWVLLIPAFLVARLPFRMDFSGFAGAYWGGTFARSAFLAVLLFVLGCPLEQTLMPAFRRYRREKARIAIALVVASGLSFILGLRLGLMVTVDALALAELMERRGKDFELALADLFWPGLYLFCGVVAVFAFNAAIAGIRFAGTYDRVIDHLDWVLFHVNVPTLSQWTLAHAPGWIPSLFEIAYYGLFPEMGAVLILAVLLRDQRHAVQYVRALLIGYTMALLVFIVIPSEGPSSIPVYSSHQANSLVTFSLQRELADEAQMLWSHTHLQGVPTIVGYYIGFPCMHIALAIICIWFLRPWKWLCRIVLAWDAIVLAPAIVLLNWHYMTDMAGGVATAFLAIWLSGRVSRKKKADGAECEPQAFASVSAV